METESCPPREFHLFPKLPLEIRLDIWRLALSALRVIGLSLLDALHSHSQNDESRQGRRFWTTNTLPPDILHVSHEARGVALKSYEPVSVWYRSQDRWMRSYVDYDKDMFFFSEDYYSILFEDRITRIASVRSVPLVLDRVRYLCVRSHHVHTWDTWNERVGVENPRRKLRAIQYLVSVFETFQNLRELQLAPGQVQLHSYGRFELVKSSDAIAYYERHRRVMMHRRIPWLMRKVRKQSPHLNIPSVQASFWVAAKIMEAESSTCARHCDHHSC